MLPVPSLIRDVARITATNVLITLGGVVSGIVVARMLGPDGRGDWAIVLLWPGIVGYLGTLGTDVVIGRCVSLDEKTAHRHALISITLALLFSAVLLVPAALILPILFSAERHHLIDTTRLALLAVPAIVLNSLFGAVALGARRILVFNVGRLSVAVSHVAFLLAGWITLGASLGAVTAAYLGSIWSATLLMYLLLPRSNDVQMRTYLADAWYVARAGMAFAPGYLFYAITNNLSVLWLAALGESRALGFYVVALAFSSIQQIFSQALAKTAFASTTRLEQNSDAGEVIALQVRRSISLLGVLALLLTIMAPWILPWIFGTAFSTASVLVFYLAPGVALFALGQIMEEVLKARNIGSASVFARALSGVVVSVGAAILIPRAGAEGMAMSYLIGGATESLVFLIYLRRHLSLSVMDLALPRIADWIR